MNGSQQLTLFDATNARARARRTDPATSHEAAAAITASGKVESDRAAILEVVRATPGLTAGEIAKRCGWGEDNVRVSRRTPELEESGLIHKGAKRCCGVKGTSMLTWYPA